MLFSPIVYIYFIQKESIGESMKENRNIRLQPVLLMMVILAVILAAILMYTGYETSRSYHQMQEAT